MYFTGVIAVNDVDSSDHDGIFSNYLINTVNRLSLSTVH